jgi:ribonuclease VapC
VIVVDTSVLVSVLLPEPDWHYWRAIIDAEEAVLPATCLVELGIVLSNQRPQLSSGNIDDLLARMRLTIQPITAPIAYGARLAFLRYGKGRHPAALNFGDCFSYAVARELDAPLLFKGTDFAKTDIRVAAGDPGGLQ